MLHEEQIDLRRQRARATPLRIQNLGKNRVFSDFRVVNPASGGEYTVAIRGFEVGDNTCTCPDYKANTLRTCKHVEAVLEMLREDTPPHIRQKKATISRPEVYLNYGDPLRLGIHLPARHSDKLAQLAARYFDSRGLWSGKGRYEDFIPDVDRVPETVTVLSDAMEFIDREVNRAELRQLEREWVAALDAGTLTWDPLAVPLYDYQIRGALFLAGRGRSILGDDMGLGKTVQTLAAIELLAQERGIARVLVIAPASVKYQWETEIRRLTKRAVQVIDGSPEERQTQYAEPTFYRLVNYEQVVRDRPVLNAWGPDVIVLDEAQRIKNWESKTSQEVKKLVSRYAIVLTGTPLENRLEELYSIVQFVDERRFGPAFQFLHEHRVLDEDGNLKGYRHLDRIREKLEPIFLRRTRAEVLTQLPARTDNTVYVELAPEQRSLYEDQKAALAQLLRKGYFTDLDRKRILACLVNLRTICDSTFLFDGQTHISPKLDEFAELVPELLEDDRHKLVVFSQWETMLQEAAAVLDRLVIGYVTLSGSLSGKERKTVLERFRTDANCRVFLSTDAGGTGLNLQMADTVVNLELPWNPAVLEQRIARVHRMGQKQPVRVINLVTRGTIEERVLRTLGQKQDLFAGLFAGDEDEVVFSALNKPGAIVAVRQLLEEAPEGTAERSPVSPLDANQRDTLLSQTASLLESVLALGPIETIDPAVRDRLAATLAKLTPPPAVR